MSHDVVGDTSFYKDAVAPTGHGPIVKRYMEHGPQMFRDVEVEPVIDLSKTPDSEGIRDGFNHPALANDINLLWRDAFTKAVGMSPGLGANFLLSRIEHFRDLSENPDKAYAKALERLSRNAKSNMMDIDAGHGDWYPYDRTHYDNSAKWIDRQVELIKQNSGAFVYLEDNLIDFGPHGNPAMIIRPHDDEQSLLVMNIRGLYEVSADGLVGEQLLDAVRVMRSSLFDPSLNGTGVSLDDLDFGNTVFAPEEYVDKHAALLRSRSINPHLKSLDIRCVLTPDGRVDGQNFDRDNFRQRLDIAKSMPWPKIEREQPVIASAGPSGADLL